MISPYYTPKTVFGEDMGSDEQVWEEGQAVIPYYAPGVRDVQSFKRSVLMRFIGGLVLGDGDSLRPLY